MIAAFRRFYRRNFLPIAKAELLGLLDDDRGVRRAVILIELLPLAGIRNTFLWEDLGETGRLVVREVNLGANTDRMITNRALSQTEFTTMLQCIAKGASLGDYSGRAKDGVSYSLCWGTREGTATLYINNPQVGSKPHQEFVQTLKRLALGRAT